MRILALCTTLVCAAGAHAQSEVRDLFEADLRAASVVTLYLLPEVNLKLMPRLPEQLKPGARVVSHDYDMGPWPNDEMIELPLAEKLIAPTGRSRIYLWVVPADARGAWVAELPGHGGRWRFDIAQKYQLLEVRAYAAGAPMLVRGARLRGEQIGLAVTGTIAGKGWNHLFRGKLAAGRIEGQVRISDGENNGTLPWNAIRAR